MKYFRSFNSNLTTFSVVTCLILNYQQRTDVKTSIAVKHFALGGRVQLETAVMKKV